MLHGAVLFVCYINVMHLLYISGFQFLMTHQRTSTIENNNEKGRMVEPPPTWYPLSNIHSLSSQGDSRPISEGPNSLNDGNLLFIFYFVPSEYALLT